MPAQTQTDASLHYCERIQNDSKREYAKRYREWLLNQTLPQPERPADLSVMAAQAVRMQQKILLD